MLMPIDTIRDIIWNRDKNMLPESWLNKLMGLLSELRFEDVQIVLSGHGQRLNSCESAE
jgi:hypothetical protein